MSKSMTMKGQLRLLKKRWPKLLNKMSKVLEETGKSIGDNRPKVKANVQKACDAFVKAAQEFDGIIIKNPEE